jgi:hypothetical protein
VTQLVEQARVLDGDDGLGREVLDQFDLLVGEGAHLLAVDTHGANQLVLLEHRHGQKRSGAGELSKRFIWPFRREVGNMDHLLCAHE